MSLLHEMGYTNVSHYPGGLTEWLAHEPQQAAVQPLRLQNAEPVAEAAIARPRHAWSTAFVNALADRSVEQLFRLWLEM